MLDNIPVIILCGGQGTRMRGGTLTKKELVEIGGRPILWHVMQIFSAFGLRRFILTLGYEAEQIKHYFLNYEAMTRDFTVFFGGSADHGGHQQLAFHDDNAGPPWQVTLVDTGHDTEKASRIARVADYIDAERFFVTYGDGVGNVDLDALVAFHLQHKRLATVTSVQVAFQYGVLKPDAEDLVLGYAQKPVLPYWINAGFMLFERAALSLMTGGDDVHLERAVFPELIRREQLMLYRHTGFWRSMDTLKDALVLEQLWQERAPWKVW
jgi:glucose-1-phosphate cytidylyltransferase